MSEEQPLLVEDPLCEEDVSKHLLDFDPNGDPENPREWPTAFKWTIVGLLALTAFTVYGSDSPRGNVALRQIVPLTNS